MRSPTWIAAAVFALLACTVACTDDDHDQFREDVFDCEDAVAKLTACCPADFHVKSDACHYSYDHTSGCDYSSTNVTTPAFDEAESHCIATMACDALVKNGVCDRARDAGPRTSSSHHDSTASSYGAYNPSSSASAARPRVCP